LQIENTLMHEGGRLELPPINGRLNHATSTVIVQKTQAFNCRFGSNPPHPPPNEHVNALPLVTGWEGVDSIFSDNRKLNTVQYSYFFVGNLIGKCISYVAFLHTIK
jgi:hypothetical protein